VGPPDRRRAPPRTASGAFPQGVFSGTLFHPTFLYELIWDLLGVLLLLWVARRVTIRPPALFALYVAYYCFGVLRGTAPDRPVHHIFGLRLNAWSRIIGFVVATFSSGGGRCRSAARSRHRRLRPKPKKVKPREIPKGPKMTIRAARPVARLPFCLCWR